MPDRRLVTKFCTVPAQDRRSRWVWTKSHSCRFPAKLLWPTCRTSLLARVYAVKPAHGKDAANILRVSCFVLSLYRKRAENDRSIKIFYCCHEGFSMNFPVFIHKNYACPISLHRRTWRAENCGGQPALLHPTDGIRRDLVLFRYTGKPFPGAFQCARTQHPFSYNIPESS